jgi:hypothetical protein
MTASALRVHGSPPAHLDIIPRINEIFVRVKRLAGEMPQDLFGDSQSGWGVRREA